jgi:general secretion pathway protein I
MKNLTSHRQSGFSLIEVLVAITILSIGLISAIRYVSASADNQREIEKRTFALWSADNYLANLRLQKTWPDLGIITIPCHQGQHEYVCESNVSNTPNPSFRHIDISVYESKDGSKYGPKLAGLAHIIQPPFKPWGHAVQTPATTNPDHPVWSSRIPDPCGA